MRTNLLLSLGLISVGLALGFSKTAFSQSSPEPEFLRLKSLLDQHCLSCHQGPQSDAGLDLSRLDVPEQLAEQRSIWDKVRQRVVAGEMPPKDEEPMEVAERQWMPDYIESVFRRVACANGPQAGPFRLRRLNRFQYNNTVCDLLSIHVEAGNDLPEDGAGGEGFDNAAETLFLSPVHGEKYLEAAREAIGYAAKNETSRQTIGLGQLNASQRNDLSVPAAEALNEANMATISHILNRFARRAFRRLPSDDELQRLVTIFQKQRQLPGASTEEALLATIQATLVSPHFLFLMEPSANDTTLVPLEAFPIASRLSYFLWDSMPDDRLLDAAEQGKLSQMESVEEHCIRMLRDEKVATMLQSFMGQWLGTRDIGRSFKLDRGIYPSMDDELAEAFRIEPVRQMQYIIQENRSLLELIDSDYVYVNDKTVSLYDIPRKGLDLNQNLKRVSVPEGNPRGGVLTMGGVLAISSYPTRTSPVLRGKWILERMLNAPPPPPPPGVPPLSESEEDRTQKTLRQRLETHRANAACASCHDSLDPLGFALEGYDALGKARSAENGIELDTRGQLPTGEVIHGAKELKTLLMARKKQVMKGMVTRLFAYAMGRGLVDTDYCAIEQILEKLESDEYRAHTLFLEIVRSVPFRHRSILQNNEP